MLIDNVAAESLWWCQCPQVSQYVCGLDFSFIALGKIYTKVEMDGALTKTESVSTNTRFKRIVKNLKLRNVADKRVFKCECHIFVSPVT